MSIYLLVCLQNWDTVINTFGGKERKRDGARQKQREIRDSFPRMWFSFRGFRGEVLSVTNIRHTFDR